MTAAKQFLTGVAVIATVPIWWALLAIAAIAFLVWEFTRTIGEGALDALAFFARRSA